LVSERHQAAQHLLIEIQALLEFESAAQGAAEIFPEEPLRLVVSGPGAMHRM